MCGSGGGLLEGCHREEQKVQAVLEDISASGACVQLEIPVPLGAVLRWRCAKKEIAGVVRYSVYREIGYFVGVQFDPASRWSKAKYHPRHLLDLEKLLRATAAHPKLSKHPVALD